VEAKTTASLATETRRLKAEQQHNVSRTIKIKAQRGSAIRAALFRQKNFGMTCFIDKITSS
jgi:hypothetical protein